MYFSYICILKCFNFIYHFQANLTSLSLCVCVCVKVTAQRSISAIFDDPMQWYIGVSVYRFIVLSVCCLFVSCLFATICFISKVLDSAQNWNIHVNHDKIRWFYFPCVVLSKQSSQDLACSLARSLAVPLFLAALAQPSVLSPPISSLQPATLPTTVGYA